MNTSCPPVYYPSIARKTARGFTLTEIAIVLGIIGLILGAIWVAAAAVYQNMRISKASTELLQITQAVRALYATANGVDPGADMPGNATYLQAGIFPTDATGNTSPATNAYNPWNGNIYVSHATQSSTADAFSVTFDAIPGNACINLLTSAAGLGRDPGMFAAYGQAAGSTPSPTPGSTLTPGAALAASAAESECSATGNGNQAVFYFSLHGSNG